MWQPEKITVLGTPIGSDHHTSTKVDERITKETEDEDAVVWMGDLDLPNVAQGIRLLGTPLGHPDFVRDQLAKLTTSHRVLLERIEAVPELSGCVVALGVLRCNTGKLRVACSAPSSCTCVCRTPRRRSVELSAASTRH